MGAPRSREPKHPKSCHERALGLLAVRARSRRELERRLLGAGFPSEEVEDALERLERVGLVDDEAFARQVVEHGFGNKKAGRRAVAGRLAAAGVPPAIASSAIEAHGGDEGERAQDLADARALRMRSVEPAKAYQRLTSLLVRRGYDSETARRAARRALEVDLDAGSDALPLGSHGRSIVNTRGTNEEPTCDQEAL